MYLFIYSYLYPDKVADFQVVILFCKDCKKKFNQYLMGKKPMSGLLLSFDFFSSVVTLS